MSLHMAGKRKRIEKEKGFRESFEAAGNLFFCFFFVSNVYDLSIIVCFTVQFKISFLGFSPFFTQQVGIICINIQIDGLSL